MAKIVRLKVQYDGKDAERGMGNIDSSIKSVVKTLAVATAALYTLKKGFDLAVVFKNASRDAEEMTSKFNTVFENISIKAGNTAESLANSFGLATSSAMKLLGSTGDLLVGFGFTEEKALEMSDAVNRLAIDLASFQNYSGGAEGASAALTKAILGETESAKSLGIVIRQDTKEFKDLVAGLMEAEGITQQQAKAQVILQQAYTQSSKAVGDFSRTQEQLANQERILEESLKTFKEMIGDKLQPVFLAATKGAIDFFRSLTETPLESTIRELQELGVASEDILALKQFGWSVELRKVNAELKKAGIQYEDIPDVTERINQLNEKHTNMLLRRGQLLQDQEMTYTQIKNTYIEMGYMEEDAIEKANTWLSMTNERGKAEQMVERQINAQIDSIEKEQEELVKYTDKLIDRETLEANINQTISERPTEIPVVEIPFKLVSPDGGGESPFAGMFDELEAPSADAAIEAFARYSAYITTEYDTQKAMLDEFLEYKFISEEEYQTRITDLEQHWANVRKDIAEAERMAKLDAVSSMVGGLAALAKTMKGSAETGKALAIVQATIDTYAGATKALAQGGIFGSLAAVGIIAQGLANVATIKAQKFAGGGDFIVPNGYPNDSYPILVESGERVQITPANAGSSQTDHLLSMLIEEIRNKPVANTVMFDDIEMARYVESGQNKRIVL